MTVEINHGFRAKVGKIQHYPPLGWSAIAGTPYRRERILAWLDPFAYRRGAGYQMWESMVGSESS